MKKMLKRLLSLVLTAALLLPCAPALAAKEVTGLDLTATEQGLHYTFQCPSCPYLLLWYKTADENGKLVLTGRDGLYEGDVRLGFLQKANKVSVDIKRPSGQTLATGSLPLTPAGVPDKMKAEKNAVNKVTDLKLEPGVRKMGFRFTAPGHHWVTIKVSSVLQNAEYVLAEQENGVFSDELVLPCVNAKDKVTVTVKSERGRQLAQASARTLFAPMEAGETAADGPLKGIRVCIDPGHQELEVFGGRVHEYPGSDKLVSGGNSTMGQGAVTLRKESVGVLEISYRLCRILRELGAEVTMTRWAEEVSVTNMERAEYANAQGADYFLRIHLNVSDRGNNNAVYAYGPSHSPYAKAVMPLEQYRDVGQTILNGLKAATGVKGGVVRMSDQFVGNNWAKMTAFLLECGFLSTPANDWILTTDDYQEKIARGIADGLVNVVEGNLSRFEFH